MTREKLLCQTFASISENKYYCFQKWKTEENNYKVSGKAYFVEKQKNCLTFKTVVLFASKIRTLQMKIMTFL